MSSRAAGPRDRRRDGWFPNDQFVSAAIKTDPALHFDMIFAAALDRMRVDVEPTDDAPSMKDAIVKKAAGKEVLLFIGEVARRHESAWEIEHSLASDLAAGVVALSVVVHSHLFM